MKKKLGVLVLTLSSLVLSAACASSSGSGQPDPGHDDTSAKLEMNWAQTGHLPSQPVMAASATAAVPATGLASR